MKSSISGIQTFTFGQDLVFEAYIQVRVHDSDGMFNEGLVSPISSLYNVLKIPLRG